MTPCSDKYLGDHRLARYVVASSMEGALQGQRNRCAVVLPDPDSPRSPDGVRASCIGRLLHGVLRGRVRAVAD